MTTAIILAAGRGSRLGKLTEARPKCLLPLAGETVLDRQIRLLKHAGVERTVVVTGYCSDDIVAHIPVQKEATTLYNPRHRGTRPISSLLAARDYLVSDTLILNGDIVFARQLLDTLLSANHDRAVSVSRSRAHCAHVPVKLEGDRVIDIGKHVPAGQAEAEFCCVAHVRGPSITLFKSVLESCAAESLHTGWSRPFLLLARDGVFTSAVDYEGPLFDINSPADYRSAVEFTETSREAG